MKLPILNTEAMRLLHACDPPPLVTEGYGKRCSLTQSRPTRDSPLQTNWTKDGAVGTLTGYVNPIAKLQ